MKQMHTKLGIFYIDKENSIIKLLDSNKKWIGNFENIEELEPLYNFDDIQDFVDNYWCDNAIWGQSIEEVYDTYCDAVGKEYIEEYEITLADFLKDVLRVGSTYFVLNYDMI